MHLLPLIVTCAAWVPSTQAAPPPEIDCSTRFVHAETDFDVGVLGLDRQPREPWTVADLTHVVHFRWTWSNQILRASEFRQSPAEGPQDAKEYEWMRCLWTGDSWYSVSAEERSYVIDRTPRLNPMTDCLAAFNAFEWSLFGAPGGLAKALAENKVLARDDLNGIASVRVAGNEDATLQIEVHYDKAQNRLERVVSEIFSNEVNVESRRIMARVVYEVVEWTIVSGHQLPQRAVRESTMYAQESSAAGPPTPRVQRFGIIRRSFRELNAEGIDHGLFAPPAAPARTAVVDTRQNVSYSIGEKYIMVDGTLFETSAAIDRIISPEELAGVLKDAHSTSP